MSLKRKLVHTWLQAILQSIYYIDREVVKRPKRIQRVKKPEWYDAAIPSRRNT